MQRLYRLRGGDSSGGSGAERTECSGRTGHVRDWLKPVRQRGDERACEMA